MGCCLIITPWFYNCLLPKGSQHFQCKLSKKTFLNLGLYNFLQIRLIWYPVIGEYIALTAGTSRGVCE